MLSSVFTRLLFVKRLTSPIAAAYPVARVEQFESCCVAFNLRKSSQVVSRFYAKEMQDSPIRGPLFALMMIIHKRGPATITALANDIGLDRTTLTRNLKPLENKGLIRILQLSANRKEVTLLPAGEVALSHAVDCWRKAQDKVVGELGEERWARMREDLSIVMALG
jgi:DNA-binding MarR family transcriptional regulator